MKCVTCKNGDTNPGMVTVPLQRNETTIIFKHVPADVCDIFYFLDWPLSHSKF
jgi:YgiT-type zinc finger domain-containing protein